MARAGRSAIVLDAGAATTIKRIADETPATRVSRVRGMLDTLSFGSKMVVVRLDDGRMLRGVAGSLSFEELKEFLGTQVVVEGAITFRPSGEPLRIEVDSASPAAPGDVIWARLPKVEPMTARPRPSAAGACRYARLLGAAWGWQACLDRILSEREAERLAPSDIAVVHSTRRSSGHREKPPTFFWLQAGPVGYCHRDEIRRCVLE